MAETSYASCGDLSLAYQVFGDGPVERVVVGPFVSHIELAWTLPQLKAFVEQLATFCCVALFDKAGVGLSDPVPKVGTLEDRATEIEAVMDAVGFGQAVGSGLSDGGPVAMMFAATRPARTRAQGRRSARIPARPPAPQRPLVAPLVERGVELV